jgi:hypothetical protein
MRSANIYLDIHRKRGLEGLPLERVYKHLFDPELWLRAYGRIYRNDGATTRGTTEETVDGMNLLKIHKIIALLKMEQYEWTAVRRTEIPKPNGKLRPLGIPMALAYCTSLQATWGNDLGRFTPPPETRKGSVRVERLLLH